MRQLVEGLAWESGWQRAWEVPSKAAIFKARQRLGSEPLELLVRRGRVRRWRASATRGAFYRGLRLMSLDGTCLDVADTAANEEAFGRPGSRARAGWRARSRSCGWSRWRSRGTHAITERGARARTRQSEQALADELLGALGRGDAVPGRPWLLQLRALPERHARPGRSCSGASKANMLLPARAAARRRLLSDARLRLARPTDAPHATAPGARRRVPARRPRPARRAEQRYRLVTHDPRPRPGARRGARGALPRALGARRRPRRAQNPPARPARRAALKDTPTASTKKPTATSAPTTRSGA